MPEKLYTDSKALYSVRNAITKFADDIRKSQDDFSQCFERMNCQIEDYLRQLHDRVDEYLEEKQFINRKMETIKDGRSDSFVCDVCGERMILKEYGDSTKCKSSRGCNGIMHRVFNDAEYNKYKTQAYQIEEKIKMLEEEIERVSAEYLKLENLQESVISLLTFKCGDDPETVVNFIDKALSRLDDYHLIKISNEDTEGGIRKDNIEDLKRYARRKLDEINGWIKDINPNYNPYLPPQMHPYNRNCGSCAFAVWNRLNGQKDIVASAHNIGTDEAMENVTRKKCKYMPLQSIEEILRSRGPGSHMIVGINRHPTPFGRPQAGHWFNAFYDGERIYTIDGQCGMIYEWPHDYGDISEWCALI